MKMGCIPMYSGSLDRLVMTIFFSPGSPVGSILGSQLKGLLMISCHGWLEWCCNQFAIGTGMLMLTLYHLMELIGKKMFVSWDTSFQGAFSHIGEVFCEPLLAPLIETHICIAK